jgi:hypothetical protein
VFLSKYNTWEIESYVVDKDCNYVLDEDGNKIPYLRPRKSIKIRGRAIIDCASLVLPKGNDRDEPNAVDLSALLPLEPSRLTGYLQVLGNLGDHVVLDPPQERGVETGLHRSVLVNERRRKRDAEDNVIMTTPPVLSVYGDTRVRQNSPPQGGNVEAEGPVRENVSPDE